ncbi:thioredoxin-disulfide reductase [Acetobacterium sp. KB-1]|jgi:thioredoxin reductase (NADPH)|uniref:thioredoxin-disulfide reductase n=1 Tax=Acetobacterium sp. KB-1 TaxID=2184575 RepID=UPI000DBEBB04|nr:thioredoxin-disulfide reductase [Acetobacterium sp. KB-1]AWW26362.1 thioredoxin-disulfide reductase [Acetobacterium sp. KB-1]
MRYDTIIVGAGPAGLAAGIYAARGTLKVLIMEKAGIGGQIATSWEIENYPGSPPDSTGPGLTERMRQQCEEFGVEFATKTYLRSHQTEAGFIVETDSGSIESQTIIMATGAEPKPIGCKGERELRGMGVSYCATCDANFFKGLKVAVIGGGDTALEEALYLTKFAAEIIIIHRRDELRGAKILQQRIRENEKISLLLDSVVEEIKGNGQVEGIVVKNVKTNELTDVSLDGVFVFAGQKPNSEAFVGLLERDARDYLITDDEMRTNIPGIFAAGDVRRKSLRQVVTATADGAIAAVNVIKYIEEPK